MDQHLCNRLLSWLQRPTKEHATSDLPEISAAIGTTVGEVRRENQDRAIIARFTSSSGPFVLAALCDGIGGMPSGDVCAELALANVVTNLISSKEVLGSDRLPSAIEAANRALYERFRGRGGTTIAAILFELSGEIGASVGDSRVYEYMNAGGLQQRSTDDTIAGELSRLKGDDPIAADLEGFSRQLAQFVGMGPNMEARVYQMPIGTHVQSYLLSSDGAHGVQKETIQAVVAHATKPLFAVSRLLQLSRWCGGVDNATVIWIDSSARSLLRPVTGGDELLEIWDSFGKIEWLSCPSTSAPSASPEPVVRGEDYRLQQSSSESDRAKKKPRSRKGNRVKQSDPHAIASEAKRPPRRTVEIEIGKTIDTSQPSQTKSEARSQKAPTSTVDAKGPAEWTRD